MSRFDEARDQLIGLLKPSDRGAMLIVFDEDGAILRVEATAAGDQAAAYAMDKISEAISGVTGNDGPMGPTTRIEISDEPRGTA